MRRALAVMALVMTFALHWFDVYQKQQMSRFFHVMYVDGQPHVDYDLEGAEKSKPRLEAYELAMLVDAPSGAFVLPVELATWGTSTERLRDINAFHERILWQFGLFGIAVWYVAGKFLDDARLTFCKSPDIRVRWYDWVFSALCLISGYILISIGLSPDDFQVHIAYVYAGFTWMLLGALSLAFRFYQWRILRLS